MENQKYTLITGASSGIGLAIAYKMAAKGKNLVLIARNRQKLTSIKKELEIRFPTIQVNSYSFDLTQTDDIEKLWNDLEKYEFDTLVNNAGVGMYSDPMKQSLQKTQELLRLNVEALVVLSTLFIQKYATTQGTQIINLSSAGGYTLVPTAITYCASKFFVSAYSEGLALEMKENGYPLKVKVLAPAATKTEFGKTANQVSEYDYDTAFSRYHTADQVADFFEWLYESPAVRGFIDRETYEFSQDEGFFTHAFGKDSNQKLT